MNSRSLYHIGHPGDLLSALLDGELEPDAQARVRAHLQVCERCRFEIERVDQVRVLLRSLPPVDPPFGFYERMLRGPLRVRRAVAAAMAGVAAAVAVVVLAAPRPATVRPSVADFTQTHAVTASVAGDPVTQMVTAGVPVAYHP